MFPAKNLFFNLAGNQERSARAQSSRFQQSASTVSHAAYEAAVRAKNSRKVGFWALVNVRGERLAEKGKV
jgi:hypothetical protein